MTATKKRECVTCAALPEGERPKVWRPVDDAPRKPRCATHRRATKKDAKARSRDVYQTRVYGLSKERHAELLEFQDYRCWICRRATGRVKALATDHDHSCCAGPTSCGECVRGKLCGVCNEVLIGRYSTEALERAAAYQRGETPMALLRAQGFR
jgi:hypothetical protein